ncbi:MAG: DUF2459 domain-containing protein [Alteripontixanthobacter sp.]
MLWFTGTLSAAILLFMLAGWAGSAIVRNGDWTEPARNQPHVEIMVETNGLHTGIVVPVVNLQKDWREDFPTARRPAQPYNALPTHLAFGWGEREVFLNTPSWSDLSPATALRVVTTGGDGLLRIGHYVRPAPSEYHRPLRIRPREYARLVSEIEATLPPVPAGTDRKTYTSYEVGSIYHDAHGRYNLTNTCNQWVSDTLAAAGIKTGWWTPFAGGVMKWVEEPGTDP